MSDSDRFLRSAALALIQTEGVRVVKSPPFEGAVPEWAPDWEDWDEVLVADGPGVRPAVFGFRVVAGDDEKSMQYRYEELVGRVAEVGVLGAPPNLSIRTVAIFCVRAIEPRVGRRLARSAPGRFYGHIKPEMWIVDLSAGALYAPHTFGVIASRAERSVREVLQHPELAQRDVGVQEVAAAQRLASHEREAFISVIRRNVPFVTYGLLAACWLVFAWEARVAPSCWLNATGHACQRAGLWLQFGAMQPAAVEHGHVWLLFTDMFVHFGLLHIFFNSVALYSLGTLVERIYGWARYALIYFVSGILASVASFAYMAYFSNQLHDVAGGASGAIFGIAGVVIVLGIRRDSIVPRAVAIQLSVLTAALIGMNLVFDVFTPGIDYKAHIGCLVVGFVMGYFLMPKTPREAESLVAGEVAQYGG